MKKRKTPKTECEICHCKDISTLQRHHIVERTELNTNNNDFNLAIICGNCHLLVHSGEIKLIGIYPSTNISGRILIYERNGVSNVPGITEPYYIPRSRQTKIYSKE
jgi:hypothetical protein